MQLRMLIIALAIVLSVIKHNINSFHYLKDLLFYNLSPGLLLSVPHSVVTCNVSVVCSSVTGCKDV